MSPSKIAEIYFAKHIFIREADALLNVKFAEKACARLKLEYS